MDSFENVMRSFEYYHNLKVLPDCYIIIRVDGKGFTKFTADCTKPFDIDFNTNMRNVAKNLTKELQGIYCYMESDEISLLLPVSSDLFSREVEKLVSISAATASAHMTLLTDKWAKFDSRIWVGVSKQRVVDYFRWRQADASRCCLNSWCYWKLREQGKTARQATKILDKQQIEFKHDLLHECGVNFNDLPLWQRRGVGFYYEKYQKKGLNPKTGQSVICDRRYIKVDDNLPRKQEYDDLIYKILESI